MVLFKSLYYLSYSNKSPKGLDSLILFIASANKGAIETTFILSIIFSGSIGIVFVTTNSFIGEFLIFSIAGPTKTPCAAPAYISFAPCSFNMFAASTSVPAVLTSSSNIKAVFENDVQTVWNVITDVKNYIWRTDLSKTEIISDKQFIEYTKNGYATTFTITLFEPYKRWEFDVENSNIKGHWIGIFTQKGEKTEIDFTEDVTAKKVLMKPFVKAYLKKQQARYVKDLARKLKGNYE